MKMNETNERVSFVEINGSRKEDVLCSQVKGVMNNGVRKEDVSCCYKEDVSCCRVALAIKHPLRRC